MSFGIVEAMPTPDMQELGTANLSLCSNGTFGATVGALNYNNVKAEASLSFNTRFSTPTALGAKIGIGEGIGHQYSPSFSVGVFDAGIRTKHELIEHQNIYFALLGKSERKYLNGRGYIGVFHGNRTMGLERKGVFIGYTQYLFPTMDVSQKCYDKVHVDAVYVTGKSNLSGFSLTGKYWINPKMYVQAGPTWQFQKITLEKKKWSWEKVKWLVTFSIDV
jgi:hypothetical protein